MPSREDILSEVADYYAAKLATHGPTARGVDWNGAESQTQRHQQFLRLLGTDRDASVLDLGCGYGDFLRFVRDHGFTGTYIGYDVAPDMIEAARRLHGEAPDRLWRVGSTPRESADYAIASGILNVKRDISLAEWTDMSMPRSICSHRPGAADSHSTCSQDQGTRRCAGLTSFTQIPPRWWRAASAGSDDPSRCCRTMDCGNSRFWSARTDKRHPPDAFGFRRS